jgi:hypothetical protein
VGQVVPTEKFVLVAAIDVRPPIGLRAVDNAGIEDLRWHDLRHTLPVLAYEAWWIRNCSPSVNADDDAVRTPTARIPQHQDWLFDGVRDPKRAKKWQATRTGNPARAKVGKMSRKVVRPARLELATSWFVARRSIQLS